MKQNSETGAKHMETWYVIKVASKINREKKYPPTSYTGTTRWSFEKRRKLDPNLIEYKKINSKLIRHLNIKYEIKKS